MDETGFHNFDLGNSDDSTRTFARGAEVEEQLGLTEEEQLAIDSLPLGSALLIVKQGPNLGARFLLDQNLTLAGRHPNADIFLDDVTVSRKHAEFSRVDNSFEVTDLGSLNGSYVNGQRTDRAKLVDGDEVRIGKFRFTFFSARTSGDRNG